MSITADKKQEVIGEYRRDDKDTGSPEVQVAVLTEPKPARSPVTISCVESLSDPGLW